jgi:hypothetical protein
MNAYAVTCFGGNQPSLGRDDEEFILHVWCQNPEAVRIDAMNTYIYESNLSPDESVSRLCRDDRQIGYSRWRPIG